MQASMEELMRAPNTNPATVSDVSAAIQDVGASIICDTSQNDFGLGFSLFAPAWPRNLTQNQLYAINQILANRLSANAVISAPTPNDVIAVVTSVDDVTSPIRGRPDQVYERTYFGPITLDRLGVKLYDDKGNLINFKWTRLVIFSSRRTIISVLTFNIV